MSEPVELARRKYYRSTLEHLQQRLVVPNDLCFVFVQHAFANSEQFYDSLKNQVAAIIPKNSSARSNPGVVELLKKKFPGKVHDTIDRARLLDPHFATDFLLRATEGKPFVILEYGAYFAPSAKAISLHPELSKTLMGFVEGTENGIKGSDDGSTGYEGVVAGLNHPVISKSKSFIKGIMDSEIGPAIVYATDKLFRANLGLSIRHLNCKFGVVGAGNIGSGIVHALKRENVSPLIYDLNRGIMADLSHRGETTVSRATLLAESDVIFLNTGSCFLSREPSLLEKIKDNAILVLSTSGDVEAGIPQLLKKGFLLRLTENGTDDIAGFKTKSGNRVRVLLGNDGVGQTPNTTLHDGSSTPANFMSEMEFVALGNYLASTDNLLEPGKLGQTPGFIEEILVGEWLSAFYPHTVDDSGREVLVPGMPQEFVSKNRLGVETEMTKQMDAPEKTSVSEPPVSLYIKQKTQRGSVNNSTSSPAKRVQPPDYSL